MTAIDRLESFVRDAHPDQFEIYEERTTAHRLEVQNQNVKNATQSEDHGVFLRMKHHGRIAFSSSTAVDDEALKELVKKTMELCEVMPEDPFDEILAYSEAQISCGSSVFSNIDRDSHQVPLEQKLAWLKDLEKKMLSIDPRLSPGRSSGYSERITQAFLRNHRGETLEWNVGSLGAYATCKATDGSDAQSGSDSQSRLRFQEIDSDEIAKNAAQSALELLGGGPVTSRECPAIFRREAVSDLIDFVLPGFSLESIDKKLSRIHEPKPQALFSKKLTLFDDPTHPLLLQAAPFDAEGQIRTKRALVLDGSIQSFLSGVKYRNKCNLPFSGNTHRSLTSPPSIGPSFVTLQTGELNYEQLIKKMGSGIVVTELQGLHTANSITGQFSLGAVGFLVENGAISRAIRGFAVAGNVFDLLASIMEVGSDAKQFGNSLLPSLLISKISVGGNA